MRSIIIEDAEADEFTVEIPNDSTGTIRLVTNHTEYVVLSIETITQLLNIWVQEVSA